MPVIVEDILRLSAQFLTDLYYKNIEKIPEAKPYKPYPPKTRRGKGLRYSDLYQKKKIKYVILRDGFEIIMPQYVVNIDAGRQPNSLRTSNVEGSLGIGGDTIGKPPISAIIDQLNRRGINSTNQVAYAISKAIQIRGIRPRPFLDATINEFISSDEIAEYFYNEFQDNLSNIQRFLKIT